jgi:hypothetical protein
MNIKFQEFIKTQIQPSDAQLSVAERIQVALNEQKNLLIATPPRFGKTAIAKALSAYALIANPESRVLYSTYSQNLANENGRQINLMCGDTRFQNLKVLGTGGALAGVHLDIEVMDDPVNFVTMEQDAEKTAQWIACVLFCRLAPSESSCIIFTTRKSTGDFYDQLMNLAGGQFETMNVPAVVERPTSSMIGFTMERLNEIRREVGETVWAATYQTRPISI